MSVAIINTKTNEIISRKLNDCQVNFIFKKLYRKNKDRNFTCIKDENLKTKIVNRKLYLKKQTYEKRKQSNNVQTIP